MIYIAKPNVGKEEKEAVNKVLESGMLACGSVTHEFEDRFSEYIGTDYGIATTSGTTALEVAIRTLGLNRGDKVLTTAYSFIASANAIIYAGLEPVFADIDEETLNIDVNQLEDIYMQNPDIKAVLVVHLFGCPCDMDAVLNFVKEHHLFLVEDCAQAHGATWGNKRVGSLGDVAAFSFYPTKNMTTGEGGMITTNNPQIADKARLLINHGMRERYHHEMIGYNYRMTNISAAMGIEQLRKLDDMNRKRVSNAKYYIDNINNPDIVLPRLYRGHVFHQFTVKIQNGKRNNFIQYLDEKEIGYGIFYPLTMPEQKCYENLHFESKFEVADKIKEQVVSLPIHPKLSCKDLQYVVECINNFR